MFLFLLMDNISNFRIIFKSLRRREGIFWGHAPKDACNTRCPPPTHCSSACRWPKFPDFRHNYFVVIKHCDYCCCVITRPPPTITHTHTSIRRLRFTRYGPGDERILRWRRPVWLELTMTTRFEKKKKNAFFSHLPHTHTSSP